MCKAINEKQTGVVIVSHDERVICETECKLYEVSGAEQTVRPFDGSFEDYRDYVLRRLGEERVKRDASVASTSTDEEEDDDEDE